MFGFGLLVFGVSIWRLQSIVEHRAATWPVMDPTWYACAAIVLAVVEVDMASMCASIPVFWPILQDSWGKIFVTQEIEIVHESRLSGETKHSGSLDDSGYSHTRAGSTCSIKLMDVTENLQAPPRSHYNKPPSGDVATPPGVASSGWEVQATSESQVTSQGSRGFPRAHGQHKYSGSRSGSRNGARYSPDDLDKETAVNLGGRADISQTYHDDTVSARSTPPFLSTQRSWPHLLQRGNREPPTPRCLV